LWIAQHQGVYRYSRDKDKARQKLNELRTQADAVSLENITVSTLMDLPGADRRQAPGCGGEAGGATVPEVARERGISAATFHRSWL
jgi:hypothetical protein